MKKRQRKPRSNAHKELERLRAELSQSKAQVAELVEELRKRDRDLARLQTAHDKLVRQLFGRKAEKVDRKQLLLSFAEGEPTEEAEAPPPHVDEAPDEESPPPSARKKRQGGRLRLPEALPRERREYHPPAAELTCTGCGTKKRSMGEVKTEQLEYAPARFRVIEHVRVKYSCPTCAEGVVCPALPAFPIDKGKPGPGLLAEVLVNKYADHLPLHRQEGIFARHGVRIPKTTLCDWVAKAAALLEPIAQAVKQQALDRDVVQMDETGIVVLDRTAPQGRRKGRIWVYAGAAGEAYFTHTPTKETVHPKALLEGYTGYLQADAYGGFDALYEDGTVVEVGCWAHSRRKFFDALKTAPEEATWALAAIRELFKLERATKGLKPEARLAQRREHSAPLAESFFEWVEELHKQIHHPQGKLTPRSPIADAVRYARNQRGALSRFLEDGRLKLDNNRAERALRKVAVGRANWLFAGSAQGAHRAAILYTLTVSCRELEISPFEYLRDVLERISTHPMKRVEELTPRGWKEVRERTPEAPAEAPELELAAIS